METVRKCSASTRNTRLAALHCFFAYVQYEYPEHIDECRKILSIKVKKTRRESINYLTVEGIKLLLEQPDLSTSKGIRDLAMLALMYDTGARVQEIINLTPSSLRLEKPYTVKLIGKGTKARIDPLMEDAFNHFVRHKSFAIANYGVDGLLCVDKAYQCMHVIGHYHISVYKMSF